MSEIQITENEWKVIIDIASGEPPSKFDLTYSEVAALLACLEITIEKALKKVKAKRVLYQRLADETELNWRH